MTLIELTLVLLPLLGGLIGLAVGAGHGGWGWLCGTLTGASAGAVLHVAVWIGLAWATRAPQPPPRRPAPTDPPDPDA